MSFSVCFVKRIRNVRKWLDAVTKRISFAPSTVPPALLGAGASPTDKS
jgi:hypothetical protein